MFRNIFNTFANCFKIPELKSRLLFTLGMLAVCCLMTFITIPGLNSTRLQSFFNSHSQGGAMALYNTFAGGGLERCAIGGIGIMPYISATIILQLLTAVWPRLSKLAREEGGRTKIIQYGRYLTVVLCLGWGMATAIGWEHPEKTFGEGIGRLVLFSDNHIWWYRIQTTLILTTGTMLLMWIGEQITDRGIGNGVSLIITVYILSRLPAAWQGLEDMFFPGGGATAQHQIIGAGLVMIFLLAAVIAGVVAVTQAQRKIPVQYAQRAVGRKMYAGGTSFMPLKVNYSGVMPIIFAQSILMFPGRICQMIAENTKTPFLHDNFQWLSAELGYGSPVYLTIYSLMILFFSYFWVATQFNEIQIADDLKKNGGYIPGVRPGQGTSDYLHKAMSRITLAGAIFLTIIATIPIILSQQMHIPYAVSSFFGGTSILITVGVLLDTMRQVESHLLMRHYDGFLKKGRLRGRF
ncbi:MAG TPA: preprotein translocase subunit SecY [Candidatus Aquilonibacter sp.]|nr:preprotein translocase subunit SecY [Candidatus Aquilonibacter sp.]